MSDQDFVKELFLAYAKQGYKPRRCRELVQAALSDYVKVAVPGNGSIHVPTLFDRVNIHRGGRGLVKDFIRFGLNYKTLKITHEAAEAFKEEYSEMYGRLIKECRKARVNIASLTDEQLEEYKKRPPMEEKVDTPAQGAVDKFSEPQADKPENFHTGGPDNFAPVEREEEDDFHNPYFDMVFKGMSKFNGDEWEGYYVYSPTTGKHYIVQDVIESIDGISTCLSSFDEIDPSTLGYRFVTGTAVEPEVVEKPSPKGTLTGQIMPLTEINKYPPRINRGFVTIAVLNGTGQWEFDAVEYSIIEPYLSEEHGLSRVRGFTHYVALPEKPR